VLYWPWSEAVAKRLKDKLSLARLAALTDSALARQIKGPNLGRMFDGI